MFEHMRDYAVKHVWCSPEQDNQIILAVQRITRDGGEIVSFSAMNRRWSLPKANKRYHVYQIGQAHPVLLGLLPYIPSWNLGVWRNFGETVHQSYLFCDIYNELGVHVPLHQSYYMYTQDRALIVCIELNPMIPVKWNEDQVYIRFYTNAYFAADESNHLTHETRCSGRTVLSNQDIIDLQSLSSNWRAQEGAVFHYINGQLRNFTSALNLKLGDVVELIHDPSVKRVVDLRIDTLKTFNSRLDSAFKYLLHYPETTDEIIDFVDDIDVYVGYMPGVDTTSRYVHKNLEKTFRMVTYRDYSVMVDHIAHFSDALKLYLGDPTLDIRSFYIRMYIRHSGFNRPLVFDNHRLFELYKLPNERVEQAMIGVNALPLWRAEELEASAFIQLLRQPYREINIDLIERAFGYNAISKILGDTPQRGAEHGEYRIFELPIGLRDKSTVYEYDAEGVLLGFYYHTDGQTHISRNKTCEKIEVIAGEASMSPSVSFGLTDIPINPKYSFRVYQSFLVGGVLSDDWKDVTDTNLYKVENGKLIWLADDHDYQLMVRSDEKFLGYEFELTPIAGTLYFDLSEMSGGKHRTMPVPAGDLDIWLNGKSCIFGLDVFLDFPRLYIVNKDYLIQPAGSTPQKITVRFTGFAEEKDGKLKPRMIEDFGFIQHGVLSNNNRFDIRDDKVLRITVKGALKHRDEVIFSELHEGVSVVNALNGQPYQVKDVVVPLRGLTSSETYALRDKSREIDKDVSDYMSLKLPQPPRTETVGIMNRHRLYSPFFSHLINDIQSGQFNLDKIRKNLSDDEVIEICKPYETFLKFDPISEENGVDQRFVLVHPHQLDTTISLDVDAYAFMKKVAKLYGKGLVVLSQHLNINSGDE